MQVMDEQHTIVIRETRKQEPRYEMVPSRLHPIGVSAPAERLQQNPCKTWKISAQLRRRTQRHGTLSCSPPWNYSSPCRHDLVLRTIHTIGLCYGYEANDDRRGRDERMSIIRTLFGATSIFTPWGNEYFARREAHERALLSASAKRMYAEHEIVEELKGGMATVLIGRSPDRELIALKTVKPDGFNSAAADLLAEEASKLIGMDTLIHLVPDDIRPDYLQKSCVIVLPYCAGGSLADRAEAGRIGFDELAYYAFVIAAELMDLHSHGILHLDLKPGNVLLHRAKEENPYYRWRPVISDYGLSVYRSGLGPVPSIGGTPFFMSPEQCLGMPVEATSDVWSFGAVLYSLATGESPLRSIWPLTRENLSSGIVKPLSDFQPDAPAWFAALVGRCLAVLPERRASSFTAVVDEIRQHVRIEDDRKNWKGSVGPERNSAALTVRDSFALTLGTRLGLSSNNGYIARIDLGWVTHMQRAEKLFSTHRAGPSRKALGLVDSVLGSWSDPDSLLGRFAASPSTKQFAVASRRADLTSGEPMSVQIPIPLHEVWHLIDLRCRCLVTLVEDLGRPADVADLLDTCTRWLATGSLGVPLNLPHDSGVVPRELCLSRIAQGFRLAGRLEQALALLEEAYRTAPEEMVVVVPYAFTLRDLQRYDEAVDLLSRAVVTVFERKLGIENYAFIGVTLGHLRVRQGNLELAEKTFEQLSNQINAPRVDLALAVVRARRNGRLNDPDPTLRWAEQFIVEDAKLDVVADVAELHHWAGNHERAAELSEAAVADPRMRLPHWTYWRAQLNTLSRGSSEQNRA
jgi:serine/threonine protein kinase